MYNKLLLATDNKGWTVCHFAVEIYSFVALEKIWDWAIKKLTTVEINNKLFWPQTLKEGPSCTWQQSVAQTKYYRIYRSSLKRN